MASLCVRPVNLADNRAESLFILFIWGLLLFLSSYFNYLFIYFIGNGGFPCTCAGPISYTAYWTHNKKIYC